MRSLLIIMLLITSHIVSAGDYSREQRIANEIKDSVLEGDTVFLESQAHPFLSIYNPSEVHNETAVLVLHGRGLHPNWGDVARPLRTGLKDKGWSTLALQMPVLPTSATYIDYGKIMDEGGPRIQAGIDFLKQQGFRKIHLIAHSCSTQMTMHWIDNGGGGEITSLVFIGMGVDNYKELFGHFPPLGKVSQPILDIYGSQDLVFPRADFRWKLIKESGNEHSLQVMVPGAEHMFQEKGLILTNLINRWLLKRDAEQPVAELKKINTVLKTARVLASE